MPEPVLDVRDTLLKLRKKVMGGLSLKKIREALEYLGWTVEDVKGVYHVQMPISSPMTPNRVSAAEQQAEKKAEFYRQPEHPKKGTVVILDVSDVLQDQSGTRFWFAYHIGFMSEGVKITSPSGSTKTFLRAYSDRGSPYNPVQIVQDIARWLWTETALIAQVEEVLDSVVQQERKIEKVRTERTGTDMGTCPVCGRHHKLDGYRMVQHGFKRPTGHHTTYGGCPGVGRLAFEITSAGTTERIDALVRALERDDIDAKYHRVLLDELELLERWVEGWKPGTLRGEKNYDNVNALAQAIAIVRRVRPPTVTLADVDRFVSAHSHTMSQQVGRARSTKGAETVHEEVKGVTEAPHGDPPPAGLPAEWATRWRGEKVPIVDKLPGQGPEDQALDQAVKTAVTQYGGPMDHWMPVLVTVGSMSRRVEVMLPSSGASGHLVRYVRRRPADNVVVFVALRRTMQGKSKGVWVAGDPSAVVAQADDLFWGILAAEEADHQRDEALAQAGARAAAAGNAWDLVRSVASTFTTRDKIRWSNSEQGTTVEVAGRDIAMVTTVENAWVIRYNGAGDLRKRGSDDPVRVLRYKTAKDVAEWLRAEITDRLAQFGREDKERSTVAEAKNKEEQERAQLAKENDPLEKFRRQGWVSPRTIGMLTKPVGASGVVWKRTSEWVEHLVAEGYTPHEWAPGTQYNRKGNLNKNTLYSLRKDDHLFDTNQGINDYATFLLPQAEPVKESERGHEEAKGAALPPGFDAFPEADVTTTELSNEDRARRAFEDVIGESAQMHAMEGYTKEPVTTTYFLTGGKPGSDRPWFVYDDTASTPTGARKFGQRLRSQLIGKKRTSDLRADQLQLYPRPLFVGWRGGLEGPIQ